MPFPPCRCWSMKRAMAPLVAAVPHGGASGTPLVATLEGIVAVVSTRPAPSTSGTLAAIVALVLAPFALGYFLSYLFRAVNAVVGPNLAADLGLSAAELGLLTAAYLLAFALFQLPLGVLLDRFGPRRVQAALLACAAAGSLLFALGQDILTLTFARALIGLGFAGGLMSGFKAVVLWVPEPRRALANAAIMSFGALGILVATVPTELAVQVVGWRAVFVGLAAITFGVATLIFIAVPEQGMTAAGERLAGQIASLIRILRPCLLAPGAAARDHRGHAHRDPDAVGRALVSRRRRARPARRRQSPHDNGCGVPDRHPAVRRGGRLVRAPRR
jgi:hypothetical protein